MLMVILQVRNRVLLVATTWHHSASSRARAGHYRWKRYVDVMLDEAGLAETLDRLNWKPAATPLLALGHELRSAR
jgi:hypothetical protein